MLTSRPRRKAQHADFRTQTKVTPSLLSTPIQRRQKGRLHLAPIPGPVESNNMLTPMPQSKVTPSPFLGQIEESQKVQNRRMLLPESKEISFLIF